MSFLKIVRRRGRDGHMSIKRHLYTCDQCSKEFEAYKSRSKNQFCSTICAGMYHSRLNRILKACEVCHKPFEVMQCHVDQRACSRECGVKLNPASQRDLSKWHIVTCEVCNKPIERRKRRQSKHVFCSNACKKQGTHLWCGDAKPKYGNCVTGYYTTKDGQTLRYDSSYELRRMKELDYVEQDVASWSRCEFTIPWIDASGKSHQYHPDLLVTRTEGTTTIEEVKGVMSDTDVRKMMFAVPFAQSKGWKYSIIQYDNMPDHPLPKMKAYINDYGRFVRPSEETIFMDMAIILAARATCLRKKVSAVFTDVQMQRVLCLGYNGNVAGGPNQCDALLEGACGCSHAEINALTKSIGPLEGATCFVTLSPCLACAKILINRGIKRVVYYETYRNVAGLELLRKHGCLVEKYDKLFEVTSISDPMPVDKIMVSEHPCCEAVGRAILTAKR